MTRKHFEALALALKNSKPVEIIEGGPADTRLMRNAYSNSIAQWRADVRAIRQVVFDYSLHGFYIACGYELESQ